jgi:hypothetical protein
MRNIRPPNRGFAMRIAAWRKGMLSALMVLTLSASLWADHDLDNKKKKKQMPEGGNGITHALVSSAAIVGAALLIRRQRALKSA